MSKGRKLHYGRTDEWCQNCDAEVELEHVYEPCPECGEMLTACSACYRYTDDIPGEGCGSCVNGSNMVQIWTI